MKRILFLLAFFSQFVTYGQILLRHGGGGVPVHTSSTGAASIRISNTINNPVTKATNGTFNYTVTAGQVNTSAGVYNASGNLVRTLWNGVRYAAGSYKAVWSGIMDDGTLAPPGTYQVKVLTNNVQYTWEGVIGNSSTDLTGDYILKGDPAEDLCFVGTKGFMAFGYSEHGPSQKVFLTSDIHKIASERYSMTTQSTSHVCTDGNIVYYAGSTNNDNEQYNYFVYGAYPADNANPYATMVSFGVNGQNISTFNLGSGSVSYSSVISVTRNNTSSYIGSICVQKTGNLLFVARPGLNQLQVLNKTTGELLQTLTYTSPTSLACDNSGNLYMVYNGGLHKFSVTTSGILSDTGVGFSNLSSPGYMDISPDYTTIAVADNATNQIKFYSISGGAPLNTLGTGVSYTVNPYVDNYKFYAVNFVKYQPDGSFWVGDKDNNRYLRFNANRTYKDQMAWTEGSRSTSVDPNTPTRVFSGFLEFERDYTKTLDNGTNGSWKLKANWKADIGNYDDYTRFRQVVTLNNNRTYAVVRQGNINQVYELAATGARATGVYLNGYPAAGQIGRDGTMFYADNIDNDHMIARRQLLTGFTGTNNPVWAAPTTFAASPHATYYTPANYYFPDNTAGLTADADRYIFFNSSGPPQNGSPDAILGYHLGAIKSGESNYTWQASKSTFTDYIGAYPNNGDFDIGNGWPGQHSLTHAMVYDHDIFWNANGEFWKQNQINIWNHFADDGLLIGQFGIAQSSYPSAAAKMAGNAFGTAMAKVGDGYYIYHCDESVHAGIHSWHVTGLNTISEQIIPLTVSAGVTIPADPASLMAGIPFRSTFTGGNGWTVEQPTGGLTMPTGQYQYLKDSVDVQVSGTGNQVVKRALNNSGSLGSWTLTGGIGMQGSEPSIGVNNYNNLEVVDVTGKVIARFQAYANTGATPAYYTTFLINSNAVAAGAIGDVYNSVSGLRNVFKDFQFSCSGGVLTFKLGEYNPVTLSSTFETGADITSPAYLRINQGSNGSQNHIIVLYKLKFSGTPGLAP